MKEPDTDHDGIVQAWRRNAERNADRNFEFLHSLKFRRYGFDPDKTAAKLHEQAFRIIDCTRCANCCKTMTVLLTPEDIARISDHLGLTPQAFIDAYAALDEDGDYWIRQTPCPFLGGDDRCTIYGVRPKDCLEYPHTQKKEFTTRTKLHARNTEQCPAVFWIVEQMRRRARR